MLNIQPPFGYRALKPFNRLDYVRLLDAGEVPAFTHESPIVPLSYSEIAVAAWHYPIIFIEDAIAGTHAVAALVGLGHNLFSRDTGTDAARWTDGAYVPAYLRRYPFCMATITVDDKREPDLMVCVETSRIDSEPFDGAIRLFDEQGEPTDRWPAIETFLKEYEGDLEASRAFTRRLAELDLLEPFTANIVRADGTQHNVTGMVRVSEEKLATLDADSLAALHREGLLGRIYIHLFSLQRFHQLLERESREQQPAAPESAADALIAAD
ncbi:SapC family protein [Burkholderia sp. BE17]|uniref:SapC family protein n=1 Tax=Burkholderia sp. BE17 TaxID=2656644 RepID=UPI00128C7B90|nr:SapC family protein [Burkholderia sp. BE17]MPV68643.1 hypothetical protein [Burkholderia sp. BE17]